MRSDVLQLARDLSLNQADAEQLVLAYSRLSLQRAQRPDRLLASVSLISVVSGTATYALPSEAVVPFLYFYGARELPAIPASLAATCYGADWAVHHGDPEAIIEGRESLRSFRVYPIPTRASAAFIPNYGEPYGRDFPADMIGVLHTDNPVDIPSWLDLPFALGLLALEFENESAHRDPLTAKNARSLAAVLEGLLS